MEFFYPKGIENFLEEIPSSHMKGWYMVECMQTGKGGKNYKYKKSVKHDEDISRIYARE